MPSFLGEIVPSGSADFSIIDSNYIRGGFKQVDSLAERDTILPDKLKDGTFVYVKEENKIYKYINGQWEVFKTGGDSGINYGYLSISQIVKRVATLSENSVIEIEFEEPTKFSVNDIIGWNISDNLNGIYTEVKQVTDGKVYIDLTDSPPTKGAVVQLCGNTTNNNHSIVLALHNSNGTTVISQFQNDSIEDLNDNCLFRLGKTSDTAWSTYGKNVYFKGVFIDQYGNSIGDQAASNRDLINRSMNEIKRGLSKDNLFEDPYFINGSKHWHSKTILALMIKGGEYANKKNTGGKFIFTNKKLFSSRYSGGALSFDGIISMYKIVKGWVKGDLKRLSPLNSVRFPSWFTIVLEYKVVKEGNITINLNGPNNYTFNTGINNYTLSPINDEKYTTLRKDIKVLRDIDTFELIFTGIIQLKSFVLESNDIYNVLNK